MGLSRLDSTMVLALQGYGWLPNMWRRASAEMVRTRLIGRPTVGLRGPEAARFFYDERNIRRAGAVPEPVKSTLFGHGAVHTLDGGEHRHRKAMFMSLMTDDGIAALTDQTIAAWDAAVTAWPSRRRVVLFDEASRVLTRGVCRWADVAVDDGIRLAADLVAARCGRDRTCRGRPPPPAQRRAPASPGGGG